AQMAIKAIRAGKHVLVEKPFAATFEEADKVVKEAKKAKIKLIALPFPSNNMPAFNALKNLIAKGVIGKICAVRARYSHVGPGHAVWFYKPPLGGPVFDLGIYPVTAIVDIIGPAKRVQAFCATSIPERTVAGEKIKVEVEDNAVINLDFGNNVLASIETNYCTLCGMELGSESEFHGTDGSLFLSKWDQVLRVYSEKEVYPGVSGWFEKVFPCVHLESQVQILAESIIQNKEPPYNGERQRHVIEILESVLKSAKTGETIALKSTF
ncbi:MAG: Gfo/Idh/MocA family oxidoreductase, partial [Candidatus Bathyarchaeia archaeon]